jgi:DNA-binding XRE family transcriptional regulator
MRGREIRMARALLRWTQRDLADKARINRRTVVNIESGKHIPNHSTLQSIRRAFEAAGIEFAETGTPVLKV